MKRNIFLTITTYLLFSILLISTSCQKKLDEDYLNPDLTPNATIEGLLTNGLQQLGTFRLAYSENYFNMPVFNAMLGTGGFANSGVTLLPAPGNAPYGYAFDRMRPFIALDTIYKAMPEGTDKKDYEVYKWLSDVMKSYIFYDLCDVYDDIPYTEALLGKTAGYYPKFDKQETIYTNILAQLKDISGKLSSFTLNTSYIHGYLQKNDIVNKGDITLWRSFVNTLRLRLAMRLTNVNAALAKTTIQEVLADGVYAKDRASSIMFQESPDVNIGNSTVINQAFAERRGSYLFLPQNMLDVLRKTGQPDDPRIKVLFQPDINGNYSAMPTEGEDVEKMKSQIKTTASAASFPSIYNRTTFEQNTTMFYLVLTSPEAHLILAEAAIRWPELGLNADEEYKKAIQESIDIYYEMNSKSTIKANYSGYVEGSKTTKPSQAAIDSFLTFKMADFTAAAQNEKIGLIFDQRYVHHNVLRPYELWSDARRLSKELGARVKKHASNIPFIERIPYPDNLESINSNFNEVKPKSNFTTPVWWSGR